MNERKTSVFRWDVRTGQRNLLLERAAEVYQPPNGQEMVVSQRFILVGTNPLRLLEAAPRFAVGDERIALWLHQFTQGQRSTTTFQASAWGYNPQVWAERDRVYLETRDQGVTAFDLKTGEPVDSLLGQGLRFELCAGTPSVARGGRLLVVCERPTGPYLYVRSLNNEEWVARLRLPPNMLGFEDTRVSHDGRWVVVRCFLGERDATGHPDVVWVFDLGQLDSMAEPATHSDDE